MATYVLGIRCHRGSQTVRTGNSQKSLGEKKKDTVCHQVAHRVLVFEMAPAPGLPRRPLASLPFDFAQGPCLTAFGARTRDYVVNAPSLRAGALEGMPPSEGMSVLARPGAICHPTSLCGGEWAQ